jgi:putative flavoprotein involved in K+ transport
MLDAAPTQQAANWLRSLSVAMDARAPDTAAALFLEQCYWRDLLSFTWNIKTMEGRTAVHAMLDATLEQTQPRAWRLEGEATNANGVVEAHFTFETQVAHGKGIVRLREGRCHTLFTMMTDLKGHEEKKGRTRALGVRHKADPSRETWSEARAREQAALGHTEEPYCLIIGGGQGGIALGARLKQLGVSTLIVEKNARAGDSWRNRYRTLVLHDPVWYDHLPYIPFPEHWPVFTPKDKMGDWLEMYAKVMELNYWTSTSCIGASYDEAEKLWTVELERAGERIVVKPRQLVFATGAYGPPRRIALAGADRFKGQILHSSEYSGGTPFKGRKCAVIGAASSGHDVCVDLWESGADVTMIQRSPTTVVKSDTMMEMAFDIYSEDAVDRGMTTEAADMLVASTPFALLPESQKALWDEIRRRDAAFYDKLAATGFAVDFGEDETGLMMKAYRTGSGYYIDVGASDLIIDGEIGVRSGKQIKALSENGILFEDGEELPADAIVMCTGYHSMHETVAQIVSREVADSVGPCWGLGSGVKNDPGPWQGELRNMWKPTAQDALWFHGGNLALSRFYSKIVALQIKARMEGIDTPVYRDPT